jgi:polyhydroxyalkanoate synthesis regulator phasin
MDEWVKEDEIRKNYSQESMDEVMKIARRRKRPWGKWKIRWSLLITLGITTLLIALSFVI